MLNKRKNRKEYLYKKSYLKRRLQNDVMEDEIAYIPCKVEGMDDIISRFSVKGVESLDQEFVDYITEYVEYIPPEYPVVLEIHGPKFSPEEKGIITETISADMDYMLGKTVADNRAKRKRFLFMIVGTVISGLLLGFLRKNFVYDLPIEFFYVVFWLFADALVRYLFIEKHDYDEVKIRVGRLASMTVEFVEVDEER